MTAKDGERLISGRAGLRLRSAVRSSPARLRSAARAPVQRRPRDLHALERLLLRRRCQLGCSQADFSKSTQALIHDNLQNPTVEAEGVISSYKLLENGSATSVGGGVFLGYNIQWQDLILGVEATYTHTNLSMTAATLPLIPRILGSTAFQLGAAGNMDLTDYGTARFRAGYVLGNFLPYGFVGMAVGRASYNVSTASVLATYPTPGVATLPCNPSTMFCSFNSDGQSNALLWGWTAGAGLDWMLTPNIFVRGEFEFVQFAPITSISATIESGRVGGGFKFYILNFQIKIVTRHPEALA